MFIHKCLDGIRQAWEEMIDESAKKSWLSKTFLKALAEVKPVFANLPGIAVCNLVDEFPKLSSSIVGDAV